ncbi:glycosyltransferase family 61 protein [Synechococcus sp. AH-779-G23]|nr:glycosyltransferase 61 family protein [Synechococcus sp. AH-779-G23]MDA9638931.1 glycosyltransferase family 61 protein [Synechococcus sp. AH-779-G23]
MNLPLLHWLTLAWKDWSFRRQQPGRWKRTKLRNVSVAPIEELLMRWAGGSVWRGGPQLPAGSPPCPALLHYRGNTIASDPAQNLKGSAHWPEETGRLFWCGPIVNHFGHQLGEFGGRLLMASLDQRPGTLLFLHPDGDKKIEDLLPWQQQWIRYLNPKHKPVLILRGGIRSREMVVLPEHQRLGEAPTPALLHALTKQTRHLKLEPQDQIVVLSRASYAKSVDHSSMRGGVAGEAAFDAWMSRQGAQIVYPETLPLRSQLDLMHSAKNLIIAEGSALHMLELLGRESKKKVMVIARRPLWTGMDTSLKSRFPKLMWMDAVRELYWHQPSNPRVKGLAKLDWELVLQHIHDMFGLDIESDIALSLNNEARHQIRNITKMVNLEKHICTDLDRQVKRAGGW